MDVGFNDVNLSLLNYPAIDNLFYMFIFVLRGLRHLLSICRRVTNVSVLEYSDI